MNVSCQGLSAGASMLEHSSGAEQSLSYWQRAHAQLGVCAHWCCTGVTLVCAHTGVVQLRRAGKVVKHQCVQ